jgi:hypothetical protein
LFGTINPSSSGLSQIKYTSGTLREYFSRSTGAGWSDDDQTLFLFRNVAREFHATTIELRRDLLFPTT